jgi:hypothetical protein
LYLGQSRDDLIAVANNGVAVRYLVWDEVGGRLGTVTVHDLAQMSDLFVSDPESATLVGRSINCHISEVRADLVDVLGPPSCSGVPDHGRASWVPAAKTCDEVRYLCHGLAREDYPIGSVRG